MTDPVVDTHVHFWDHRSTGLRYAWLDDEPSPLGDVDGLRTPRHAVADFRGESRLQHVTKVVHMDAAAGSPDPVAETAWLQSLADATGWPDGIVASCDLAAPDAARQLERHAAHANLRGVRDMRPGSVLSDDAFRRGYALLAGRGLVFCHTVGLEHAGAALDLVRRFPDVTFCLDQAGMPEARDDEYFAAWRGLLATLAGAPNAVCKISSLGMRDPAWTVASRRPWVLACLDAFGPDRCFFGSNWPIERRYASYGDTVGAFREIVSGLADDERAAVLAGNAERIFRI